MTIKAYRSTRHNTDRKPKQSKRPQTHRSGSLWGVIWQTETLEDESWDAMPDRHADRRR